MTWANKNSRATNYLDKRKGDNKMLVVDMRSGRGRKTAIKRRMRIDLSKKKKISMMIFNPNNRPVFVALAIETSNGFHETRKVQIKSSRWNDKVTFSLVDKKWKSKATNWAYKTKLKGVNRINSIILMIYHNNTNGELWFDHIRAE